MEEFYLVSFWIVGFFFAFLGPIVCIVSMFVWTDEKKRNYEKNRLKEKQQKRLNKKYGKEMLDALEIARIQSTIYCFSGEIVEKEFTKDMRKALDYFDFDELVKDGALDEDHADSLKKMKEYIVSLEEKAAGNPELTLPWLK